MKKNKLLLLLFVQIFIVSTILVSSLSGTILGTPWNNILINHAIPKDSISTSATPNLVWTYDTGTNVRSVDISADGQYFVSGDGIGNVTLFNRTHGYIWNYTGTQVNDVAISADSQYIVSGDIDGQVTLFNKSGFVGSYDAGGIVGDVSISENGSYFVSGDSYDNVTLFNNTNNILNFMWNYTMGSNVRSVAISEDGNYIAASDYDNVTFFNKAGYLWHNDTAGVGMDSLALSQDGQYFIGADINGILYFYDRTDSGNWDWSYDTKIYIPSVDISADGGYIVAGTNDACNVTLFNRKGSLIRAVDTEPVHDVAISADGRYFVAGDDKYVWLCNRFGSMWNYSDPDFVRSVAISANGEYIVAGSNSGIIYLFYNKLPKPGMPVALFLILDSMQAGTVNQTMIILFTILGIGIGLAIFLYLYIIKKE